MFFMDIWDISKNNLPVTKHGSVAGHVGDVNSNRVKNRIQGILHIAKRSRCYLYKSFESVQKGANLSCTQLMDSVARRGTGLAPSICLEVDGGSENQNRTVFALCADLVGRGCTDLITAHRLPIHHTHNRLDGYFGTISQHVKGKIGTKQQRHSNGIGALSQQDWDSAVRESLGAVDVEVVNTYAVYDFESHYAPHIDKHFSGYGSGSLIRVIQFYRGASTAEWPKGEPLVRSGWQCRMRQQPSVVAGVAVL